MPDLPQAGRRSVPAVLLQTLRRRRSAPLVRRRLCGSGDGRRRRGRAARRGWRANLVRLVIASRRVRPDDKLREAIQGLAKLLDCFVAPLLAMTGLPAYSGQREIEPL